MALQASPIKEVTPLYRNELTIIAKKPGQINALLLSDDVEQNLHPVSDKSSYGIKGDKNEETVFCDYGIVAYSDVPQRAGSRPAQSLEDGFQGAPGPHRG